MITYVFIDSQNAEEHKQAMSVLYDRWMQLYLPKEILEPRETAFAGLGFPSGEEGVSHFVVLAISDSGTVQGGLVFCWHENVGIVELRYAVRRKSVVFKKLGRQMYEHGVAMFCEKHGVPFCVCVDVPRSFNVFDGKGYMGADKIRSVFGDWGGSVVPVRYERMICREGGIGDPDWDLMVLPGGEFGAVIQCRQVIALLSENLRCIGRDIRRAWDIVYVNPYLPASLVNGAGF